jgi:hypothetical protein
MASRIPARTVWSQRKTLEDYEGTLTEQLGSLLRAFGLSTDIPVKTYTYKDDGTAVKYRVVIMLPDGLAASPVQPSGEGRGQTAAYHEAVVRAIATIREYRAVELVGTTFTAIPHDSLMDEPGMDHDVLVKKKPKLAARLLDRYRKMVGSLYNTHQVIVEDKAEMLDDLTDTTRRQERAQMTRQESEGSHFSSVVGTHNYLTQPGPSRYSPTPEPIYYPVITSSMEAQQGLKGVSESELPMENSDGWRFDWLGDGQQHTSSYGGTAQAAGGGDVVATPIVSIEEEDPMEVQFESEEPVETPMEQDTPIDHTYCTDSVCYGEAEPFPTMTAHETRVYFESYLGLNGLVLSDTSMMDTSDSDYVPGGRPFVLETVCRTTRQHGWTPGMYYEP